MAKEYKVLSFDYVDASSWEMPNYTKRVQDILNKHKDTHVPITVTRSMVVLQAKN